MTPYLEPYLAYLPTITAFFLAYFGSMAGITGAFLLIPFQISVMGDTSPSISATNFLYNIYTIPSSIIRLVKEKRMNWPLAWLMGGGSMPGIVIGYIVRVRWLNNPEGFRRFAGLVLLYLAWRVLGSIIKKGNSPSPALPQSSSMQSSTTHSNDPSDMIIRYDPLNINRFSYSFSKKSFSYNPLSVGGISFLIGIIGGAYGIGGGAVLVPYCISVLGLPVHSVSGATLFATFLSSIAGIIAYGSNMGAHGINTGPDIWLGTMFGIGGIIGGYLGTMTQRYIPERPIKITLFIIVLLCGIRYIMG